ncbi:MAG: SDR family NAD(P)-dependent oxidoreductase, partial [Anaerolineae bacterium]|nr:SDR family NAD(P)-dependent oxidoreductase [Anaerolineae bacterium]
MNRTFITGANRGIGLELTRQSLQRGDRVFASCRLPDQAEALQQLQGEFPDRLTVLPLDVTETSQIETAVEIVSSHTDALDLLLNNAAVAVSGERLGNLDPRVIIDAISVNSVA